MPSQIKIINAVNHCLKQMPNIDFELDNEGVCGGLAGLYVKYSLENKTPEFFKGLEQLALLPRNYKLGSNQIIDDLIIQIERIFNSPEYNNHKIMQGALDKTISINRKPLSSELNLGLITDEERWVEIIRQITKENRSYLIGSTDHAIAFHYKKGQYTIYDPNYNVNTKVFTSPEAVIQELKLRFDYNQTIFGLSVRVFAHPEAIPENFPSHETLQKIAFKENDDIHRTVNLEGKTWQSSNFACDSDDQHTINQLCKRNAIYLDHLRKEYLNLQFNDHLTKRELSPRLQKSILSCIKTNIDAGHFTVVETLLTHYKKSFTTEADKQLLNDILLGTLVDLNNNLFGLMRHASDYSYLINLFEPFKNSTYEEGFTHYNHLKILTLIKIGPPNALELFFKQLTEDQLAKQIQLAATLNAHTVLTLLLNWMKQNAINPKKLPSIYNQKLINQVNLGILSQLIDSGFAADPQNPELLSLCTRRKDRSIFELYVRSFSEQEHREELWASIDKNNYAKLLLEEKIGSIALINVLILLRKNEHIKNAWSPAIGTDTIKSALTDAIMMGSGDISIFLQEQLQAKKTKLDDDTVDFLCQKALKEKNLDILFILSSLDYNIFRTLNDVKATLNLCNNNNEFLPLEYSLDKASLPIKKALLETSLKYGSVKAVNVIKEKDPSLFAKLINDCVGRANSDEKLNYLSKMNNIIASIPSARLTLALEGYDPKAFIIYAYQHKLFHLINRVSPKVTWSDLELKKLVTDLIGSENEAGLIQLFKEHPHLGQDPTLIKTLAEKNLLHAVAHLLSEKTSIEDEGFYIKLAISSIRNNNKNLISLLIQKGKISTLTPFDPDLTILLKECIEKGFLDSLDPFIHSSSGFGLNFKSLFQYSCVQKQAKIANALLHQKFELNEDEIKTAMEQLFGEQSHETYFETVYQNAFGRLYGLLLKTNMRNPHGPLLQSIKNPSSDSKLLKTAVYLLPLKQAVKEKNMPLFNTLFKESTLPKELDKDIIKFLNDPMLSSTVLSIFEQKYGLEKLLEFATSLGEWGAVANLLEHHLMSELSPELQELIQKNAESIIQNFIQNLEKHHKQEDVRPRLHDLRLASQTKALSFLAKPYHDAIQNMLEIIELAMIKERMSLNGRLYRLRFDIKAFENALEQLNKVFVLCHELIKSQTINLDERIVSSELITAFAQIKEIMVKNEIAPYYLNEEDEDLLFKLAENPRFKTVCKHELQLYALTKDFNLAEKSLEAQTVNNQIQFNDAVAALYKNLAEDELPITFVIPQIQPYLKRVQDKQIEELRIQKLAALKASSSKGIKDYLDHRGASLGIFSWLFDYNRGKTRANHYLYLIRQATTIEEIHLINYAIMVNPDGIQLKQGMAIALGYKDVIEAKAKLKEAILTPAISSRSILLDQLIESINKKVNHNDSSPTAALLKSELEVLSYVFCPQPDSNRFSFFQTAANQPTMSWWKWFTQWFKSGDSNEDRLTPR